MTIKLEVGKKYELNNGEVHECTKMFGDNPLFVNCLGYGPFIIDAYCYHQDGTFGSRDYQHKTRNVKRCVEEEPVEEAPEIILSSTTIDAIALDSLKWHYDNSDDMEPLQKEAFRIVMRYYGV